MHGVSHPHRMCLEGNQQCCAATTCDFHHLHGTGMGIWLPNDESIRACTIGREVRKEPFAGEALLAWEVTQHIMTSAHEWTGFGERCARTAFCMATVCVSVLAWGTSHSTPCMARVFSVPGRCPTRGGGRLCKAPPPLHV
jgi:hypothetical protein